MLFIEYAFIIIIYISLIVKDLIVFNAVISLVKVNSTLEWNLTVQILLVEFSRSNIYNMSIDGAY